MTRASSNEPKFKVEVTGENYKSHASSNTFNTDSAVSMFKKLLRFRLQPKTCDSNFRL